MILKHGLLGLSLVGSLAVLAAPVGAGSGWLLLVPPVQAPGEFDTTAPLNRWVQIYALDKATECESAKIVLRAQQISILNESEETPPRPPTPEKIKRREEEAKESERRCEELLERAAKDNTPTKSLRVIACEVLREGREEEAQMTPEQKQQRQRQWEESRARRPAERRARQELARKELARLDHLKCVPADAVYGPGVKRQP